MLLILRSHVRYRYSLLPKFHKRVLGQNACPAVFVEKNAIVRFTSSDERKLLGVRGFYMIYRHLFDLSHPGPSQLLQQQSIHFLRIVEIQMMSRILDNMPSAVRVPGSTHVFDSIASTVQRHPVVIAINERDWNCKGCNPVDKWHTSICTGSEEMC